MIDPPLETVQISRLSFHAAHDGCRRGLRMNFLKWAPIALILISQSTGAAEPADPREPLVVTPTEKAYIFEQMRLFVTSIQTIVEGLSTGNDGAVADTAA